jgi:hypothetical protein
MDFELVIPISNKNKIKNNNKRINLNDNIHIQDLLCIFIHYIILKNKNKKK